MQRRYMFSKVVRKKEDEIKALIREETSLRQKFEKDAKNYHITNSWFISRFIENTGI